MKLSAVRKTVFAKVPKFLTFKPFDQHIGYPSPIIRNKPNSSIRFIHNHQLISQIQHSNGEPILEIRNEGGEYRCSTPPPLIMPE